MDTPSFALTPIEDIDSDLFATHTTDVEHINHATTSTLATTDIGVAAAVSSANTETATSDVPPATPRPAHGARKRCGKISNTSDEMMEVVNLLKETRSNSGVCGVDTRTAVALLLAGFVVLLSLVVAAVVVGITYARAQVNGRAGGVAVESEGSSSSPLRMQPHFEFVGLPQLYTLPLHRLQEMQSLVLQWGEGETIREYFFHIESAVRIGGGTTLHLSSDHTLVATQENAVLLNPSGDKIGVVDFAAADNSLPAAIDPSTTTASLASSITTDVTTSTEADISSSSSSSSVRRLGAGKLKLEKALKKQKFGRYPHNQVPGPPETFFDKFCRYGCGKLAVTFPYYYRPFFGYGYPLVGTQAQFPQGYGGNPGTEIMAQQAGM